MVCGVNGAGKSQLLFGIANNIASLTDGGHNLNAKLLVSNQTLVPENSAPLTSQDANHHIQLFWSTYNSLLGEAESQPQPSAYIHSLISGNNAGIHYDIQTLRIIQIISERAGVPIDKLSSGDFFDHFPIYEASIPRDLFNQNFTLLFKRYQDKALQNQLYQFLARTKGQEVKYLEDADFIRTYGEPPWEFLNKFLSEAKLDYRSNIPALNKDAPYEFRLVHIHNSASINFKDLSAGERVIMSLVVALYNMSLNIAFPKVILMDEPDASLHPSMARYLIKVVQDVLVGQRGIKVILSTHSPSTVAMAPEDAVYIMRKEEPRIEKASRDVALKLLTLGVPSLSINYENRKQIFVESKYDVAIYDGVYDKLKDRLLSEISLNFIASGVSGSGSCDQVEDIVKRLRDNGNKTVYGIIDWDRKNSGSKYVKVMGFNSRYSIENYILDPLMLGLYLLREKFITREDAGLKHSEMYTDIRLFEAQRLQIIINFVLDRIKPELQGEPDNVSVEAQLVNGKIIYLPRWFMLNKGHDLEEKIKKVFPKLNRFQREGELKMDVIRKVVDDLPELLASDILNIFKELQES
jgi:predicted ATPase